MRADETKADLEGLAALVVEDEALVAMLIEDLLAEVGCASTWAARVDEGMAQAREARFDFAVVDRNLGGADSGEIVATLRARGVPVVIASGYEPRPRPCADAGVTDLRKPFELRELVAAVRKAMGEQVEDRK